MARPKYECRGKIWTGNMRTEGCEVNGSAEFVLLNLMFQLPPDRRLLLLEDMARIDKERAKERKNEQH